jgi:hypothetical protein
MITDLYLGMYEFRYHSERLANGLGKAALLNIDLNSVIDEPYYAHLDESNSGSAWTDRPPNARIRVSTTYIYIYI